MTVADAGRSQRPYWWVRYHLLGLIPLGPTVQHTHDSRGPRGVWRLLGTVREVQR